MPSETVTATRLRTCSGCLPNQSSARAQALAAFSRKTGRPTTDSSMARRSMAGQPRFGANIRRPCASTRPGRLTPTPSTRVAGNWARSAVTVSASRAAKASGVGRGVPLLLGLELRVEAGEADRRELGPQLDADGADALGVDVQEARPAAAREEPELAFVDPALDDQLVDDGRDGAALQAGSPGQIGPGQRFVPANQAERDSTVDLPRRFAGRDLEAGEVDLAHAHLRHERAGEQRLPDP